MRTAMLTLLLAVISFSGAAQQKDLSRRFNAFSGTLRLGVDGGMTLGFTDYQDTRPDAIGRVSLEYLFPSSGSGSFGIKGFFSSGYIGGEDISRTPTIFRTNFSDAGGGISYTVSVADLYFPYIFAGVSHLWFDPEDDAGNALPPNLNQIYDKKELNYHGEAGIHFLVAEALSLNLSIAGQFSPSDNWDNIQAKNNNDFMLSFRAGVSYSFFTSSDSDGDGVPDDIDQCPNTPSGITTDEFGCPVDQDKDGVPDYLDKCPNTPPDAEVNEDGCQVDSDNDGVADEKDRCPNTPKGAVVNEFGCPDTDNDGVADNEDKCPETPKGAPVDEKGCPKDSDNDGVPDFKDKCPNTPAGIQVDMNGCETKPDTVKLIEKVTLSGDTNFEFNKSALLPTAYPVLDNLAETMMQNPDTRWRVEGHTDAVGSDAYNMELSRRRAESVVNYLTGKGIDRSRLEVIPLGESQPIADNNTPEGRAMNRRVEIRVIR